MKPNQYIRDLIRRSPLKNYEVAQALGYSSGSALSTRLQTELSEEDRQYFIRKINELSGDQIDGRLAKRDFENKYIRNTNKSYVSKVLEEINQLRLKIDSASTKEDFERISELALKISRAVQ